MHSALRYARPTSVRTPICPCPCPCPFLPSTSFTPSSSPSFLPSVSFTPSSSPLLRPLKDVLSDNFFMRMMRECRETCVKRSSSLCTTSFSAPFSTSVFAVEVIGFSMALLLLAVVSVVLVMEPLELSSSSASDNSVGEFLTPTLEEVLLSERKVKLPLFGPFSFWM